MLLFFCSCSFLPCALCRLFNMFLFSLTGIIALRHQRHGWSTKKTFHQKQLGPPVAWLKRQLPYKLKKKSDFFRRRKQKGIWKLIWEVLVLPLFFPSHYCGIFRYPIFSPHRVAFAPLHPKYSSCNPVALHHLRHIPKRFFTAFRLVDFGFPEKYY